MNDKQLELPLTDAKPLNAHSSWREGHIQTAFKMRYEGVSDEDIGAALGRSKRAIGNLLSRKKKAYQKYADKRDAADPVLSGPPKKDPPNAAPLIPSTPPEPKGPSITDLKAQLKDMTRRCGNAEKERDDLRMQIRMGITADGQTANQLADAIAKARAMLDFGLNQKASAHLRQVLIDTNMIENSIGV